jgi:two-component system chemotaxis response regulator CheY
MGKRILITDDTAFMRMTLRNVLEKNGYEVVGEAEDGLQAVEMYSSVNPDLVTMDITMPKMDGIEAIKRIMKKDPDARIIVVSAMGQKALVIEGQRFYCKTFSTGPHCGSFAKSRGLIFFLPAMKKVE